MRWLALPLLGLVLACGSTGAAAPCVAPLPPDTAATGTCLTESLRTERDTYAPGHPIIVTVTALNASPAPCAGARGLVCGGPSLAIQESSGRAVFTRQPPLKVCPLLIRLLAPGETQELTLTLEPPALAPGVYSIAGTPGASEDLGRHYFRIC